MTMSTLSLGIDAGGTKTRIAYRASTGGAVTTIDAGGANLQRDGMDATVQMLTALIDEVRRRIRFDGDEYRISAGIAGAGTASNQQELTRALQQSLHARNLILELTTDAEIAFRAAFGDDPGILLITGTGSILWARSADGTFHRAGGWGFLLGDEGGGYRIGLAGLKALADSYDGGPETRLLEAFAKSGLRNRHDMLTFVYAKNTSPAQFAPVVLNVAQSGDMIAERIVYQQTLGIATRYHWLLKRVDLPEENVVLAGGLSRHPYYRQKLIQAIQQQRPEAHFTMLELDPAVAALRWAEALKR